MRTSERSAVSEKVVVGAVAVLVSSQLGSDAMAQGCVAARGAGLSCAAMTLHPGEVLPPSSGFQGSVGYRWFESGRHFVGDEEQTQRQAEGSEVINNSNFIDLGLTYAINPRFSATLTVPFVVHDRSQVVRANDPQRTILNRFHTQAASLADLRLMGNGWVLSPAEHQKWNVLLGVGVDMPTGQDDVRDTFQIFDPATGKVVAEERNVDQSIQPGDGGWGLLLDIYSYYQFCSHVNLYVNGSYSITPEETSGVATSRSNPYEAVMSIADTYMGRAGLEYVLWSKIGLTVSLGARIEGVPVYDAVGGSDGFRRPGFSLGIEPGLAAMWKGWAFNLYTPVALYRNRERSVPDKQWTEASGVYRHGDAAFSDFTVLFGLAKHF